MKRCVKDTYKVCVCDAAALKSRSRLQSVSSSEAEMGDGALGISLCRIPVCWISPSPDFFQSKMVINSCWGIPSCRNFSRIALPYVQKQLPCLPFPLPPCPATLFAPLRFLPWKKSLPQGCSVAGSRRLSISFPLGQKLQDPKDP